MNVVPSTYRLKVEGRNSSDFFPVDGHRRRQLPRPELLAGPVDRAAIDLHHRSSRERSSVRRQIQGGTHDLFSIAGPL